ncbi:hypothetical protein OG937_11165 [Streptomyces sp. NBC_00510]
MKIRTSVPQQAVARHSEDPADELLRSVGRQIKIFRERARCTQATPEQLHRHAERLGAFLAFACRG